MGREGVGYALGLIVVMVASAGIVAVTGLMAWDMIGAMVAPYQ